MLRFLVVIVKQALRGFPHIAHKPFLIQNDRPLLVKVLHFAQVRKCSTALRRHSILNQLRIILAWNSR